MSLPKWVIAVGAVSVVAWIRLAWLIYTVWRDG